MKEIPVGQEFYFQWHLTERCNRSCSHCYQGVQKVAELPLADLVTIVDLMETALMKWGRIGTLSLTGGEPLLRRSDLHALMTRLDQSERVAYYDILTNGSLISEHEALSLSKRPSLRRVQVSLEGAAEKTNDSIRGEGSFESTLSAIRRLRNVGVQVAVMMTVSRLNAHEIGALVNLLGSEDVQSLALERLIPEGTGIGLADQVLSPHELHDVYEEIHRIALDNPPVRLLLYRPLFAMLSPDDPTVGALCSVGNNALTVMPDGTVLPCRRLPIPIGNALTDGFFKIWYGSELLWQIRNPENIRGKCGSCELFSKCRGCRAMAYFASGDYLSEDPQCWH